MFKVGDKVFGTGKYYDYDQGQSVTYNYNYNGIITKDFDDGSYEVATDDYGLVLIELYENDETMQLDTKLSRLLQGDSDV
jgi:hypothetical protein